MLVTSKSFQQFIFCLLLAIINGYLFNYLNQKYFYYVSNDNELTAFPEFAKFLIIVIVSPIVETWLFNYFPITMLKKKSVKNPIALVVLPSIIFALFHLYHPIYFVMSLVGGIIMNWYFIKSNENPNAAFLSVALLHGCYNLYGYAFVS